MRILIAHNYYREAGGEDRVLSDEADLLKAHGHTVDLYTRKNDSLDDFGGFQLARITIWNREVYADIKTVLDAGAYDLLHVHNTLPLISPSIFHAARKVGVPTVQTLHNFRMVCANGLLFRDGSICEKCLSERFRMSAVRHGCYRNSRMQTAGVVTTTLLHRFIGTWSNTVDAFIALTSDARDKFVASGIPSEKIHIKPNFVEPPPEPGSGNGQYALFVGRLSPEKGIDTLLKAWSDINDPIPLKILGDGPMAKTVESAAERMPHVEWLGFRNPDEVQSLMKNAFALVFPSNWYEGFSRVPLESMAVGTPVVASSLGAAAELITDRKTGLLFPPGDSEALRRSVMWLLSNPERLAAMRIEARREIQNHYSTDSCYKELMRIYDAASRASP